MFTYSAINPLVPKKQKSAILNNTKIPPPCFGDLWVNKVSISFLQQLDRKNNLKHRYNYIDLALMGYVL